MNFSLLNLWISKTVFVIMFFRIRSTRVQSRFSKNRYLFNLLIENYKGVEIEDPEDGIYIDLHLFFIHIIKTWRSMVEVLSRH